MKKTSFYLGALALAMAGMLGISSCSQDDLLTDEGGNGINVPEGDGFYMGLTLKMPTGDSFGRSETTDNSQSTNGTEIGSTDENTVSNVLIVLAKSTDNSFIVSGNVASDKLTAVGSDNSYKTIAKLQKTNLADYYNNEAIFSSSINVFVFCNPVKALSDAIATTKLGDTNWLNLACDVTEGSTGNANTEIWKAGSFLMSNFKIATREIPSTLAEWDRYKTEATAFDLSGLNAGGQATEVDNSVSNNRGAVEVHRSVARFDFRDGSGNDNTYDVVKGRDADNKVVTLVQIKLNRIALANMCNKFYYLHRVSDTGQAPGVICGAEKGGTNANYIVGPYADKFNQPINGLYADYMNYPFFDADGSYKNDNWYSTTIDNVLKGRDDNYEGTYGEVTYKPGDYKVWRYLTENVIPSNSDLQQKGVSTTVIFKGKMIATDALAAQNPEMAEKMNGTGLTGDPSIDPILYQFNGSLYFTWPEVQKAAIKASVQMTNDVPDTEEVEMPDGSKVVRLKNVDRSNPLYVAVYGNGGMGTFTWGDAGTAYTDDKAADPDCANTAWTTWNGTKNDANLKVMREKVTGAHFTIYQSSNDPVSGNGYYCYYYYYNRHNDNNLPGTMGPMEFGVVRNNVYKLAVTNISQLGHPRIPENDPDKPKPDDPDETDDIYLTVTCRVLPWVVRVNNIEF